MVWNTETLEKNPEIRMEEEYFKEKKRERKKGIFKERKKSKRRKRER